MKIALVYSSFNNSFAGRLEKMISQEIGPSVFVHTGESGILSDIIQAGRITETVRRRFAAVFRVAEECDPDIIVCTCSSVGELAEDFAHGGSRAPVLRIDEPMIRSAVLARSRIGVLGTLETTIGPSTRLATRVAEQEGKSVKVLSGLASGAYEAYRKGDFALAGKLIAAEAQALVERGAEIVLFAQASMATVQDEVQSLLPVPVVTSPQQCARHLGLLLAANDSPDHR